MGDIGQLKILIIGGYGTFGGRLVELLADEARLHVIVAGRSFEKAQALCDRLAAEAMLVPHALDRDGDIGKALSELAPHILVDATGPFQAYGDDPYRLVRQCIAQGVNYLDFADGTAFARDIRTFDEEAKAAQIFALSAASSSPALSAAVVRELAKGLASVEHVEGGIAPSPFAGIGLNVIRAITGYAGKPLRLMRNGHFQAGYGLTEARRVTICPPGQLPLGSRRFALVDVPDLELLPEAMPGLKSAWFGAGAAPQIYLRLLMSLAWLARAKLLPGLAPLASLFHSVANRLTWGERRGGMFVKVSGRDNEGRAVTRSWHLLAEGDTGPSVPAMAIDAIIRKCLAGHRPETGARAATEALSLADFERGFAVKNIVTGIREQADGRDPLYRRILGAAWDQLPGQIQDLHSVEMSRTFSGRAQVSRGRGLIARIVGALYRFPREGPEIPVHVLLERRDDGELWQRNFAGRIFRSWQREGRGRSQYLIDERFGPVSVGLALVTGKGRLEYIVRRWSFLGLPMPMFMAPGGRTFEFVDDGRFRFHVEIAHPWFGLIVRYQGWLEPIDRS
ncbi:MAG: saccharopine dehydrogenase [Rhizobium sp.]|nr:saccharopine dehydrogenase [Rhizobium sp.]